MDRQNSFDLHEFYRNLLIKKDNEELIDRLASHSRIVTREKGEILFRPDDSGSFSNFLVDGVVKSYIVTPDGTEQSFAFWFVPGTQICLTKDMINIPGIWCKALTRCTCVELNGTGIYELTEEYPDLYRELTLGFEPFYLRMMDKFRAGYIMTAKERYLWFLKEYGPIVDKISLTEIALFLGIQLQSLSRIRAELQEEGIIPPPEKLNLYEKRPRSPDRGLLFYPP